eukprot:5072747-Prymnesium_polylepis.1
MPASAAGTWNPWADSDDDTVPLEGMEVSLLQNGGARKKAPPRAHALLPAEERPLLWLWSAKR